MAIGYFASDNLVELIDPIDSAPDEIRQLIYETRSSGGLLRPDADTAPPPFHLRKCSASLTNRRGRDLHLSRFQQTTGRTALGVCGIEGCGQLLFDSIGCLEHAQHATDAQRLEARMQRLVKRRVRRYY
jgi:hypothetical protein